MIQKMRKNKESKTSKIYKNSVFFLFFCFLLVLVSFFFKIENMDTNKKQKQTVILSFFVDGTSTSIKKERIEKQQRKLENGMLEPLCFTSRTAQE